MKLSAAAERLLLVIHDNNSVCGIKNETYAEVKDYIQAAPPVLPHVVLSELGRQYVAALLNGGADGT